MLTVYIGYIAAFRKQLVKIGQLMLVKRLKIFLSAYIWQQQQHGLDKDSLIAMVMWFCICTDVSESDRLSMECGECGANAIIGRQGVAAR